MDLNTISRSPRPGFALAGLGIILFILTGCAVVDDVAHGQSQSSFADAQLLEQDRGEALTWMPDDAREIIRVTSTRSEGVESLTFTSKQGLSDCETTERLSSPTMDVPGGLDVYDEQEIALCGEWAIAEEDGAFYAWTPGTESDSR